MRYQLIHNAAGNCVYTKNIEADSDIAAVRKLFKIPTTSWYDSDKNIYFRNESSAREVLFLPRVTVTVKPQLYKVIVDSRLTKSPTISGDNKNIPMLVKTIAKYVYANLEYNTALPIYAHLYSPQQFYLYTICNFSF